ncbi:nucleotide exchange factor GrpE [Candidatus Falkowbacteria bacterium]|nr:nucleotide exchange factor GrpE [Candidatus Falkowbacteria bacterium]
MCYGSFDYDQDDSTRQRAFKFEIFMEDPKKDDNQIDDTQKQIEDLKKQCDEYLNGWKRAKADYINFKKETEEKQKEIIDFANSVIVVKMIPIYDNLKKALSSIPVDKKDNWVEGIVQIKKQFEDFLKANGIEEIKTIGEKFDPEFHEAVSKEKKEGFESGIIISEANPGYLIKGKVLIPAKVIVAE